MTQQAIIDLGIEAVWVAIKLAAPGLLAIMLAGLLVSIFQAATQINEQTLSFIPKILALSAVLFVMAPWIMNTMLFFTSSVFKRISTITG
jgi:flagellar biosynthetic protein FliQ